MYEEPPSDLHYRLYLNREGKMIVVQIQEWDAKDGYEHRFLCNDVAEVIRFKTKLDAIRMLNKLYKSEYIDPEYLSPSNPELLR